MLSTDGSNEATDHVNYTSSEFYFQTQAAKVTSTNASIKDIPVSGYVCGIFNHSVRMSRRVFTLHLHIGSNMAGSVAAAEPGGP